MTGFHRGEIQVQGRLLVREDAERVGRIVASEIPPTVGPFLRSQRMAVAASLVERGRPWASLLTGPPGFIEVADEHRLRIAARPIPGDPLAGNLRERPELGLLVFDPRTRRRLRLNGQGLASSDGLLLLADEVYGNCPKYIQQRRLVGESEPHTGHSERSSSLDERSRALVGRADTFFIATWHPEGGADASHRGGRPGFVRVRDDRTLEFPDYPGNNMFNTLGNLVGHPRAGLLFVDFERGDLLQLTGIARVLWEPERAVRVAIEEVRVTPAGHPLRYELVEPWPGNPPLRSHAAKLGIPGRRPRGREEERMTKHIACGDVVEGCAFTAEAATESELVEKVKAHAAKDHGVKEVTPELAAKVEAAIQDR